MLQGSDLEGDDLFNDLLHAEVVEPELVECRTALKPSGRTVRLTTPDQPFLFLPTTHAWGSLGHRHRRPPWSEGPSGLGGGTSASGALLMNRPFVSFLLLAVVLLTIDLASKSVAFARVAGEPIDLSATGGRAEAIPAHDPVIAVPKLLAFRLTLNRVSLRFGPGGGPVGGGLRSSSHCGLHSGVPTPTRGSAEKSPVGHILRRRWEPLGPGHVRRGARFVYFSGVNLPFGWSWPGGAKGAYLIFNAADVYLVLALGAFAVGLDQPKSMNNRKRYEH